jgi:hypothetical protein
MGNNKNCKDLSPPLNGTDKLESEAGSIFTPSRIPASRIPDNLLIGPFKK